MGGANRLSAKGARAEAPKGKWVCPLPGKIFANYLQKG